MTTPIVTLFTRPDRAWQDIRQQEQNDSRSYLPYLLLTALIPSICLFIGVTFVGWSLVEDERVTLDMPSALQLCVLLYLTILAGTLVMGIFLRWMARSFEVRPSLNECIGFIAYTITPFLVAGLAGLYPSRWLAVFVLILAAVYSTYLLFVGLPTFMRQRQGDSILFAICAWAVGLLVLVTMTVSMILLWELHFAPTYERDTLQNQSYPTRDERPQGGPGGV